MNKKLICCVSIIAFLIYCFYIKDNSNLANQNFQFKTKFGYYSFVLKIANTPTLQAKGLMSINILPLNEGMIFIYPNVRNVTFWMKNTYITLDIIFINESKRIVYIHKNALPMDESNVIHSPYPVKYVVEINGGLCDKLGINIGDYLIGDVK